MEEADTEPKIWYESLSIQWVKFDGLHGNIEGNYSNIQLNLLLVLKA